MFMVVNHRYITFRYMSFHMINYKETLYFVATCLQSLWKARIDY